jgi:hypothetical protein
MLEYKIGAFAFERTCFGYLLPANYVQPEVLKVLEAVWFSLVHLEI